MTAWLWLSNALSREAAGYLDHGHQRTVGGVQEREHRKEAQLKEVSKEALQLRNETARLEGLNNNLQGYGLEDLTHTQLSSLVDQLNQVRYPAVSLN